MRWVAKPNSSAAGRLQGMVKIRSMLCGIDLPPVERLGSAELRRAPPAFISTWPVVDRQGRCDDDRDHDPNQCFERRFLLRSWRSFAVLDSLGRLFMFAHEH